MKHTTLGEEEDLEERILGKGKATSKKEKDSFNTQNLNTEVTWTDLREYKKIFLEKFEDEEVTNVKIKGQKVEIIK